MGILICVPHFMLGQAGGSFAAVVTRRTAATQLPHSLFLHIGKSVVSQEQNTNILAAMRASGGSGAPVPPQLAPGFAT